MRNWILSSVSLLVIAGLTGCQSLTTNQGTIESQPETISVQIRASGRKPKNIQLPLTPNMRLQDVVNVSNANFRNKIAYVVRTSPSTGEKHKLQAQFGSNRRISLETDYAIQPGDRVVIAQDTTSSFDRVMKTMLGRT
jgi:hypothetical protein